MAYIPICPSCGKRCFAIRNNLACRVVEKRRVTRNRNRVQLVGGAPSPALK